MSHVPDGTTLRDALILVFSGVLICWVIWIIAIRPFHKRLNRVRIINRSFLVILFLAAVPLAALPLRYFASGKDTHSVEYLRKSATPKRVFVLIHGWHGEADSWKQFSELMMSDETLFDSDIVELNYKSDLKLRGLGISDISNMLLSELKSEGLSRDVYILAHSLGGIIARRMILKNALSSNPVKFRYLCSAGSPFGGANPARIANFFNLSTTITREIDPGSPYINSLQQEWSAYIAENKRNSFINVCIGSLSDELVSLSSALNGCSDTITLRNWKHNQLITPESLGDERYKSYLEAITRN